MGGERRIKGILARGNSIRVTIDHKLERYVTSLRLEPNTANLRYAERQRTAWLHELEKGIVPDVFKKKEVRLIGNILDRWLSNKKGKSSTLDDYRKSVNILKDEFGNTDIDNLTLGMVREFCHQRKATEKRIKNLLSPLRMALDEAVEDDSERTNILKGWTYKAPETEEKEDPIDPFTKEEQVAILDALPEQGRNLIQFAFWTGLRTSELVGLKWTDIDFVEKKISIRRGRTQAATKAETPKTKASIREVSLLSPALDALQKQKAHTFLAGKEVFHNPRTDEPWRGDAPIRKTLWTPALKKAGVRYRKPYQTRHTFASMMMSSGEHPQWVARQMGHTDWSMTARKYARWMPEAMPDAGKKAEAIFGSKEVPEADKNSG